MDLRSRCARRRGRLKHFAKTESRLSSGCLRYLTRINSIRPENNSCAFATASLALLGLSLSHVGDGAEGPALPITKGRGGRHPLALLAGAAVGIAGHSRCTIEQDDHEALNAAMIDAVRQGGRWHPEGARPVS